MTSSAVSQDPPNLALIGCGAIAQAFYLPAIARNRELFGELHLADPSSTARSRAAAIVPGSQGATLDDLPAAIDLVIVATPNHLHYPVAREALQRGAHVLLEKPFAIWPAEGRSLERLAAASNRVLAINQTRRLNPVARELRTRIRAGQFGELLSITHHEGTKLVWPFESGVAFAPEAQRTGVIMDFGVHVVDLYQYLIEPDWTFVSAVHDGFAGPEGLAELELRAGQAPVSIRLSRYYPQENVAHLRFERADISFGVFDNTSYVVDWKAGNREGYCRVDTGSETPAEVLLSNFLAACAGREPSVCDAASSLPVISLLDEVYDGAARYPQSIGSV